MSIETPDGILDVTNATLRVPQIEVQGTSVTTSLSTLSNVGVGTSTPGGRLHVYGPDAKTLLQSTSNTANVEIGGPTGAIVDLKGPFADDYDLRIQSSGDGGNFATTGNVNHIRLSSTGGYTGFGTSSPQYKIDVQGVKGVDATSNPSAHNPVFLYDDQESTTTFAGTVGGTASRDTTGKYLELNALTDNALGYIHWPIQMPNSWTTEFDHYIGGGDGGESLSFSFFNTSAPTTTGNHGGYRLAIAEFYGGSVGQNKAVLYYQGSEIAVSSIGVIPSGSWNKVVVQYDRGSISMSFNGRAVFSYEATENADSYTGRYVGFIGKTSLRDNYHRVRNLKCTSGMTWIYPVGSNASTIAYLSGNVGIGTNNPLEQLHVASNVKATHFIGDGGLLSNIATTLSAIVNQGNVTSNTVQFTNSNTSILTTGNVVVQPGAFFVGDGSKLVNIPTDFESIIINGNTTSNIVYFNAKPTAIRATGNIVATSGAHFVGDGGLLSNIATTLESIVNQGNTTSNTVQFTNVDTAFVTSSNVGIANTAPTNNLDIGSNLSVLDTGSNVLTVRGNVSANTLTLGDFQIVPSYGLNHVTAENNQTGDTLVLTNATKGIDASSNIELGGTLKFDSNVVITGGGAGTYLSTLRVANVASNIVTYDQATGEVFDSGGLISNKLAIVSEQPPSALTGATTVVDGHGRYVLTTSNLASGSNTWNAFDGSSAVAWVGDNTYDGASNAYAGSVQLASSTGVGEWLSVEFPYKTTLRHVKLTPGATTASFPGTANLYATNDGSTWTLLKEWSDVAPASTSDEQTIVVNASASYKRYAIVATKASGDAIAVSIGEWKLFTETFTVDAGVVSTTAASGLDVGYTEHPVEPMTDFKTYVEGHGTYEASASNVNASYYPWQAFDHVAGGVTRWSISSPENRYNITTGEWDQTAITTYPNIYTDDVGGTRYAGHWLQIKLPYAITLSHSNVHPTNAYGLDRAPKDGVILGSNDGENWYKLTQFTGKTYTSATWTRIDVNATTPYQYYRMCITKIVGGTYGSYTELTEWRLFAEKPVTRMENVHISGELSSETLQTGYIKWPKVPLKANASEGYVAIASSSYYSDASYAGWHAFEDKTEYNDAYSPSWASGKWTFVNTTGLPDTANCATFDGISCEWLDIKCPQAFELSYFTISERKSVGNNAYGPKDGYMYATNDGVQWTRICAFSGLTYSGGDLPTRVDVQSSSQYDQYRLLVTKVGAIDICVINELQLFEAATGVGGAPTSAKLQVHGSLGLAKGSSLYAGDSVVAEFPKHDRPLTKYPEVAMTAASTAGYVASASSSYDATGTYSPWRVFDGVINTDENWISLDNPDTYSPSTGIATSQDSLNGQNGSYVTLELPKPIKPYYVKLYHRPSSSFAPRAPKSGYVYGSNDNTSWTQLGSFSYSSLTGGDSEYKHIQLDSNNKKYKYLAFQVTTLFTTGAQYDAVAIRELEYWGHEEGDESVDVVHRSVPNKPGQQQLAVYWDANDSNSYSFADSSNVYDLSGSGVTGAISGVGYDAVDNAFTFDGVDDTISSPTTATFTTHTATMWIKFDTPAQWEAVYAIEPSTLAGRDNFTLYVGTGYFRLESNGGTNGPYFDLLYNFVPGAWVHLTLIFRGTGLEDCEMYIDNTKLIPRGVSRSPSDDITITGTNTLYVGTRGGYYLDGSIANFRLFSKALSADQIRELYEYDAPRFGHRTNVVALHKGNLGVGVTTPTSRFEVAGREDLQEYPPRAMTGYETYMEGHGVFRVSQSSEGSANGVGGAQAWKAFDDINDATNDNYWNPNHSLTNHRYGGTDGIYTGIHSFQANSDSSPVGGEWLKIEFPHKFKLNNLVVQGRYNYTGAPGSGEQNPTDFRIIGSNDDSNWYILKTVTNQTGSQYPGTTNTIDTSHPPYKYYVFHVTHNAGSIAMSVGGLQFFGTPAPSGLEDGHLTLGKALTAPRFTGHAAGAETPRAESLVVHYDTTVDSVVAGTTVVDTSGNGLNGTLNGGATYSSPSRAFNFNSASYQYIESTPIPLTGDAVHSVSCWTYVRVRGGDVWHITDTTVDRGDSGHSALLTNSGGGLHWYMYNNDVITPNGTLVANTWNHVACVYYGGGAGPTNRRIYINGVSQSLSYSYGNTVNPNDPLNLYTSNVTFALGFDQARNIQQFEGQVSNAKLYNVALTADEVAAEYALGRTGKSLNVTDTAVCLGGTVPRAQLDVRGSALFGGNVGVGTTNPGIILDVGSSLSNPQIGRNYALGSVHDADKRDAIYFGRWDGTGRDFLGMKCRVDTHTNLGYGDYSNQTKLEFYTWGNNYASTREVMCIRGDGNVGIGTVSPAGSRLHVYNPTTTSRVVIERGSDSGEVNLTLKSSHSSGGTEWQIYHAGATANLIFWRGVDRGYFRYNGANTAQNFTGQHRTFIKDVPFTEAEALEGLIVSSDQNKYIKMSGGIAAGSNAITTNESLPVVSLSTKVNDKKCFGVVSTSEDPETREEQYGNFVSVSEKELGDTRVYINSVGEGAIWVTNINGPLESGDYITTSNVAGYGQKQDDDTLHNYTVAKITMDCDFNPVDQPVQRIVKELTNVNYWINTTYSNVTLEEYSNLAEASRTTVEETYYTRDIEELVYTPYQEITEIVTADDEYDDVSFVPSTTLEEYSNLTSEEQASYTATYTKTSNVAQFETIVYTKTTTLEVSAQDEYDVVTFEPFTTLEAYSNLTTEEQNTYSVTYTKRVTSTVTSVYYDGLTEEEQAEYTPKYTKTVERTFEAHELSDDEKAASTAHTRTIYQKIERDERKEDPSDETYELEVREELVNVLDEHGQLQWEDTEDTEKAYKIRYLTVDGTQTDEANAVHIAAFVGCTYHCG